MERVIRRAHRDLLVVGSSRRRPEGCARIGKCTRQLSCHGTCVLAELGEEVDLLVIGSRRRERRRVLLGSTGEALMHDARCPIMVVPHPQTENRSHSL